MRILALAWPTDNMNQLMINGRRDLICPAIDGISNELLNEGHSVTYVNIAAEVIPYDKKDLKLPAFISGLPFYRWSQIKNKNFDIIWHAIKDPTPPEAIKPVNKIMKELDPSIPVLNSVAYISNHTKIKYISLLREKGVGAIILDDYKKFLKENGDIDENQCFPSCQGALVSLDKYAIRLHNTNNARSNLNKDGITLKYQNNVGTIRTNLRSYFRIPYAAGKCLQGTRYFFPPEILCPKTGQAIKLEDYSIPDMTAGTISAAMEQLGVQIAHIEGINAGFTVEIFDVNPFPSSSGISLTPMSKQIAKRITQVFDI